jgi:BASS family bile acid:Na+ symporter
MEALQHLIPLVFAASLFLLVLNVGLDSTLVDLMSVFRSPGRLLAAFVAVSVIVPVAGIALVHLIPISAAAAAGVLLMGISPAPPLVPGKMLKFGGDKAYAYGVYTALILLAVVSVPLWVMILDALFVRAVALPAPAVARNVAVSVLLPLLIGLALRRLAPSLAAKVTPFLPKVAMAALLIAFVPMVIAIWPAMVGLAGDGTGLVMALMAAVGLAAGHLLGGPTPADRASLAVTAATRHPGIALMIAAANAADNRVKAAILGYLLVGMMVAIPYQLWIRRRAVRVG